MPHIITNQIVKNFFILYVIYILYFIRFIIIIIIDIYYKKKFLNIKNIKKFIYIIEICIFYYDSIIIMLIKICAFL